MRYNQIMVRNAAILERVMEAQSGDLAPELARYLLRLDFPRSDHERYAMLADKAQQGSLSPEEQSDLDDYLDIDAFLSILQSKARVSLRKHNIAA